MPSKYQSSLPQNWKYDREDGLVIDKSPIPLFKSQTTGDVSQKVSYKPKDNGVAYSLTFSSSLYPNIALRGSGRMYNALL